MNDNYDYSCKVLKGDKLNSVNGFDVLVNKLFFNRVQAKNIFKNFSSKEFYESWNRCWCSSCYRRSGCMFYLYLPKAMSTEK